MGSGIIITLRAEWNLGRDFAVFLSKAIAINDNKRRIKYIRILTQINLPIIEFEEAKSTNIIEGTKADERQTFFSLISHKKIEKIEVDTENIIGETKIVLTISMTLKRLKSKLMVCLYYCRLHHSQKGYRGHPNWPNNVIFTLKKLYFYNMLCKGNRI